MPTNNDNAFASTFYFFSTHDANAEKNNKSLQANAPDSADFSAIFTRPSYGRTEARTDNSGFKKLAVQWLIEHSTSHQHLWWLDSFVLRNRQLLKPEKRQTVQKPLIN